MGDASGDIPDVVELTLNPANDGWSLHDHDSLHDQAGDKKKREGTSTPKLWSVKAKISSRRGGKANEPSQYSPKSSAVSSISHFTTTSSFRSSSKITGATSVLGLDSPMTPRQKKDLKVKKQLMKDKARRGVESFFLKGKNAGEERGAKDEGSVRGPCVLTLF